jgi:1,4-alpha-glucan branching enzyme
MRCLDETYPDIVTALADAVRQRAGRDRHVHIVLENDRNEARRLARDPSNRPRQATAQWNDDIHHALHVLVTGECDGYYADYAARPLWLLGRCLAEGFAYQGEPSPFRDGAPRGEPSARLPASAFVSFTQTHDQVGNRARGERLSVLTEPRALRAAIACVLLAPSPPMLFMGEEFGATTPFLSSAISSRCWLMPWRAAPRRVRAIRTLRDPASQVAIPDPNALSTYASSKLD